MTENAILQGVLPPLTTPFDAQGAVDEEALEANVEGYNACGLSGYVIFGSNGEAALLDAEERRRILRRVRRSAKPGMGLVAGIHQQSTLGARRALEQAAQDGADMALVITPYFYKGSMGQPVLEQFFLDVAEDSPLPIVLYNIPQNTGVTLAPETVGRLSRHRHIVGCKDSSGNLGALASMVRQSDDDFRVLVGNAAIFYPALALGADGAILAVACVAPKPSVALYRAFKEGDHDGARRWQDRLAPLGTLVTATYGIAGLKACLDAAGWRGGSPRPPLQALPADDLPRLQQTMTDSGFFAALESFHG